MACDLETKQLKRYFNSLTGIRAIAAMMVVFFHSGFSENQLGRFLYNIQLNLNIGVSIFFCLSGFLLTYRYYDKIEYNFTWFRSYLRNRFAKIYPVYFAYTLFVFLFKSKMSAMAWFAHFTLLVGFLKTRFQFIPQAWSLTVEEMFYFYLPLFIYLLKRKKNIHAILLMYVSGVLLYLANSFFLPNVIFNFDSFYDIYRNTLFGRIFEFFSGSMLALYILKYGIESEKETFFTYIGSIGIMLVLFLLAFFTMSDLSNAKYYDLVVRLLILPIPTCLLFYGLIVERTIVSHVLSSRVFIILGKSSYILYMIHMGPIGGIIYSKLGLGVVTGLIALQLISIVFYKLWEEPVMKLIRKN